MRGRAPGGEKEGGGARLGWKHGGFDAGKGNREGRRAGAGVARLFDGSRVGGACSLGGTRWNENVSLKKVRETGMGER